MADKGIDIEKAKAILSRGDLVAIPTETVYGLAANALNAEAVAKIFATKNRPTFDPLIVHVPDLESVDFYVDEFPLKAQKIASLNWPGPLTLVLKKKRVIPDIVTAGMPTVGIRCPDHILSRQLLRELPFPLAAPSANPFGYVSPTRADHVNEQLGDKIDYILDGGPCTLGIESTIIGFDGESPTVYRLGALSIEKIESLIGKVQVNLNASSNPKAPGQLRSHYAPRKRLILGDLDELLQKYPAHCSGILSFKTDYHSPHQVILSPSGSLEEAAKNLFSALRTLDKLDVEIVLAELVPDTGVGRAINDRLRRATVREKSE